MRSGIRPITVRVSAIEPGIFPQYHFWRHVVSVRMVQIWNRRIVLRLCCKMKETSLKCKAFDRRLMFDESYLKLFCLFGISRGSKTDTITFVLPISMYADPFAFDITFSFRTGIEPEETIRRQIPTQTYNGKLTNLSRLAKRPIVNSFSIDDGCGQFLFVCLCLYAGIYVIWHRFGSRNTLLITRHGSLNDSPLFLV